MPRESELKAMTSNCSDNFNVQSAAIADGSVAILSDIEGGEIIENMDSLVTSTLKWNDTWGSTFDKISAAHAKQTSQGLVNFVMRINPLAVVSGLGDHSLILFRVNAATRSRKKIATIKLKKLCYIHSFGITEEHALLACAPLTWELKNLMVASLFSNL